MKSRLSPRYIALGLIVVGLGVALYSIALPLRSRAQKTACQTNLKQIELATMQYVRDYDELFMLAPKWKEQLAPYGSIKRGPATFYICPTSKIDYAFNSALNGLPLTLAKSPLTLAMFYEPSHPVIADNGASWNSDGVHGAGSNVCFQDGHVAWVQSKPKFSDVGLTQIEEYNRQRYREFLTQKRLREQFQGDMAARKRSKGK